jgi:hypothetical protein
MRFSAWLEMGNAGSLAPRALPSSGRPAGDFQSGAGICAHTAPLEVLDGLRRSAEGVLFDLETQGVLQSGFSAMGKE